MKIWGIKIWRVTGHSMFPRIPQYSYVLAIHWFRYRKIKPKHTILIDHPKHGLLIKTVAFVDKNSLVWCKGENPSSIRVEELGPVNSKQIIGQVIKIFKKH